MRSRRTVAASTFAAMPQPRHGRPLAFIPEAAPREPGPREGLGGEIARRPFDRCRSQACTTPTCRAYSSENAAGSAAASRSSVASLRSSYAPFVRTPSIATQSDGAAYVYPRRARAPLIRARTNNPPVNSSLATGQHRSICSNHAVMDQVRSPRISSDGYQIGRQVLPTLTTNPVGAILRSTWRFTGDRRRVRRTRVRVLARRTPGKSLHRWAPDAR